MEKENVNGGEMAKTGRPKKEISIESFEKLCAMLCTEEEIASYFNCSVDTIGRWCKATYGETFAESYKKHSASGKISLRRYQFNLAKTSAAMAIFLGKNILGQSDMPQTQSDANELIVALTEVVKKRNDNSITEAE